MMKKGMAALIFLVIIFLCSVSVCEAKSKTRWEKSKTGVGSLMDLSSDRGHMLREYDKETKRYAKIKKAIERDDLEKGEEARKVTRLYGSPVIVLESQTDDSEKWVYKPGDKTFLEGKEKAYLVFDGEGKLESWELVQEEPGSTVSAD